MPEPGWIPKHTQPPGSVECMRLAVSCASGIHWRRLRFIDPRGPSSAQFWLEWERLLAERGHWIQRCSRETAEASRHYWIATVDSFVFPRPTTHVIVMQGGRLHYDSGAKKRKRAPRVLRSNPMLILPIGETVAGS